MRINDTKNQTQYSCFPQRTSACRRFRSHECFRIPRWRLEVNNFLHGCCDLSSNFLTQYLKDCYPKLMPEIVPMQTTDDYRREHKSSIQSHVITKLDNWYIDLTLNQFEEYRTRLLIEEDTGTLETFLINIRKRDDSVKDSDIKLSTFTENKQELYAWLCSTILIIITVPYEGCHSLFR